MCALNTTLYVLACVTCYCISPSQASKDDSGKTEVMKLKRRFLKDRTAESSYFAKMELRKKSVQQVN